MIGEISHIISAGILGIFAGAQLCEGALMVPHWKSLDPKDFFELHQSYGKKIYRFFAPLTILATLIPVSTSILSIACDFHGWFFSALMGVFSVLFFSTYFLYFKRANQSFAEASIDTKDLPKELKRWELWHWSRIGLEFAAFTFALLALPSMN